MEMCHENYGQVCRISLFHFVQQRLEETCLPLFARSFGIQYGEVLRIDMRHGYDVAFYLSPVSYFDDVLVQIHCFSCTFDAAHDIQAEMLP